MSDLTTLIDVHNVTVSYDNKPVLWDIDIHFPKNKLIGIIGPNGSGKTTLLKTIMGLLPKNSGYIKIDGKNIDDVREQIAYIPQKESIDWDFPAEVLDVVLMGRTTKKNIFKRISKKDKEIALDALKKVKLLEFKHHQISELSGGQQQRVFIARALTQQADIYLMDEPFAGVDAKSEEAILLIIKDLIAENKTVVIVHHDLISAAKYFDWIVLLNTRLINYGETSTILTEENLKDTFGGELTILSEIRNSLKKKSFPLREDDTNDKID